MAKRHHSSGHAEGHYEGMEARRTQEMQDGGMIREDRSAIANLPQNVMIKAYPYAGADMPEGLDDTISGIDHQMNTLDDAKRRAHNVPKKV
jgi:hypothetical protein